MKIVPHRALLHEMRSLLPNLSSSRKPEKVDFVYLDMLQLINPNISDINSWVGSCTYCDFSFKAIY